MKRLVVWAVACSTAGSVIAAQGPVAPPTAGAPPGRAANLKPNEVPIVVSGCLSGTRLKRADGAPWEVPTQLLNASEFVLDGPRELIQQIRREHDRHYDEIAGIATVPLSPSGAQTDVETKELGKRTRVTVGERRASRTVPDPPRPIKLKVQSLTHINDMCASTR